MTPPDSLAANGSKSAADRCSKNMRDAATPRLEARMDLRKLKTLIDLVSESNISELEITEADGKVRIVKADPRAAAPAAVMMPAPAVPVPTAAAPVAEAPVAAAPAAPAGHVIKAPMVGTFYRSSTPGGKPFADVGTVVKEGDPLCIIEAMKIMNEIEADRAGTVTQVMCENGQAVEFGQPLFVIE
jgi:acetyl-CoA carboxylase biotin carboxyl carrier protein